MPIQIPRVQAAQTEDQVHAPRLEVPKLDPVSPMAKQTAGLETIAKDAIKTQNEIQDQTADTMGTNAKNEFLIWRKKRIYGDPESGWNGYANMKGDPQDIYKKYDEEEGKKLDELAKAPDGQDWTRETQNVVNRRLSKAFEESKLETLTQYFHQKKRYDDDTTGSAVQIAQQGMYSGSSFIEPGNSSSYGLIHSKIAEIRDARIAQALRNQSAIYSRDAQGPGDVGEDGDAPYLAPDGTKKFVKLTPMVKHKIKQDIAEGLNGAISNLIDSKDVGKAQAMKEEFSDYLDGYSMSNLDKQLNAAVVKRSAYQWADKAMKGQDDSVLDQIEDPEVRHEAKKLYSEEQRYNEMSRERKSKANYDKVSNYVNQVMRSDSPYAGPAALEADPTVSKLLRNVTDAKQKQAIYHLVDQPKETSKGAQDKISNLMFGKDPDGNTVKDMNQEDFDLYLAGLSKPDRRKYQNWFDKIKDPKNSELEAQVRNFGKELESQGIGAGLLKKPPNSNIFYPDSQVKISQWKKEIIDAIADQPVMTPKERSDFVAKFIADKQAGRVFQPSQGQKFNGTKTPSPKLQDQAPQIDTKTDVSKFIGNLTPSARMQYILDYRSQYKQTPNEQQLIDYIGTRARGN